MMIRTVAIEATRMAQLVMLIAGRNRVLTDVGRIDLSRMCHRSARLAGHKLTAARLVCTNAGDPHSTAVSTSSQPPPTLRGVRERGTKPREEVALHGWSVWCFGARAGFEGASSDD
jgi:hypothetical protein